MQYANIFTVYLSRLIELFLFETIVKVGGRKKREFHFYQLGILFLIMAGCVYLEVVIYQEIFARKPFFVTITSVVILALVILIIWSYDMLTQQYQKAKKSDMLDMKNQVYKNELTILREQEEAVRRMRHDTKNHCLALRELARQVRLAFNVLFPNLQLHCKVSRIYRDARRLYGRGPYKDHLWFCVERPAEDWTTRPTFWFELGPDYWGYGMGCWMARPMDMAKLRSRIIRDPKPMEKLTKALRGQTEFTLGGDTYKRPKAGAPSELLAPWFQMKTISITHEEKLTEELFSRDVVDRIKTGYTFLLPYYDYFLTLPSDPEPETQK